MPVTSTSEWFDVLELQRRIVLAVLGAAKLDAIEAMIIHPAPVEENHKSALWLFADGLLGRRRAA